MSTDENDIVNVRPECGNLLTFNKQCEVTSPGKLKNFTVRIRGKRISFSYESLLIIITIAGVFLGLLLGFIIRRSNPTSDTIMLIMFPGELLMRMLKMLIIPIIITSVITGLSNLETGKSGKIGGYAVAYYILTTTLAVILGIILVTIIKPGNPDYSKSTTTEEFKERDVSTLDTFLDLLRNLFPSNILAACFQVDRTKVTTEPEKNSSAQDFSNTSFSNIVNIKKELETVPSSNILGIISFCVFFGLVLARMGDEAKVVKQFFNIINNIFMEMITVIIWYSPIGICSLIAGNLLKMSTFKVLAESLGLYVITVISGLTIHATLVLPVIFWIFTRKSPLKFYAGVFQAWLTALGTGSSAGTLPVTIKCLEDNLNIDQRITRFVLPLGATMNMDGTALLEGVAAITIAQMYSYTLSFGQIITISVTATVASIGAAAIPSAGLITLLLVLSAIGLPTEAVGILWSIDWFLDRIRTSVNVLGDCIGAGIIQHLNKDILHQTKEKLSISRVRCSSLDTTNAVQQAGIRDINYSGDTPKQNSSV